MDEKEVIDLCGESQTTTSAHCKAKQSKRQENHDMDESKTIARKENENRPEKYYQVQETEENEVTMMCWENMEGFSTEEPNEETGGQDGKADNKMEEPINEEEHANHMLHTGN